MEQGVLHKNNAARRKSRLMKAFAKMEPAAVSAEAAMVEPVVEPEVKKAAPRRRGAKAEVAAEPMAETKKAPAKKTAAKKAPAKKTGTATKKPAAKKEE